MIRTLSIRVRKINLRQRVNWGQVYICLVLTQILVHFRPTTICVTRLIISLVREKKKVQLFHTYV